MDSVERCGDCRRPIVSADDRWTRNNGYRVQCTVCFDAESDGTRARLAEIEAAQAMRDVLDDARGIVEVRVASDDGDSQRLVALARALLSCDRERDAAQHAADALRTALDGLRAAVLREREARREREAALCSERRARLADVSVDRAAWGAAHDQYITARVAHESAAARVSALLSAAPPPATVPAALVRAYLASEDAHKREATRWQREYIPAEGAQRTRIAAASAVRAAARAALDAALAGCRQ